MIFSMYIRIFIVVILFIIGIDLKSKTPLDIFDFKKYYGNILIVFGVLISLSQIFIC
jgi:hypothetical protein